MPNLTILDSTFGQNNSLIIRAGKLVATSDNASLVELEKGVGGVFQFVHC
jgi:hypothetical protein